MHGDFSARFAATGINDAGILHQQGRVSLDADGNALTWIATDWQDTEARDIIGAGVAAIPAETPDGFRIKTATLAGGEVEITIEPGRAWVDGLLVRLEGDPPISRIASYLQPPVQDPAATAGTIANGIRDAVVLEVWRESLNAFQRPALLIEPALGGPDTIERLHTSFDFRLLRLGPGDDCGNLTNLLDDNIAAKGHLTVNLLPPTVVGGDCPVFEGGGYTGFEHNLYRIEIAEVDAGAPMFKWSQFNGGLVGRAEFDGATNLATITANLQPIITSGRTDFYLEALEPDVDSGTGNPIFDRWRVVYGAAVALNNNDQLVLPLAASLGTIPAAGGSTFFRLWNEIRPITDFPTGLVNPNELADGICLAFDPDASGAYAAGDYWTFAVRAGGIANPQTLVDDSPPEGIRYHRVPLAILSWDGTPTLSVDNDTISDCRGVFEPLTRLTTCCTVRVGDGINSHGEFTSIQAAIDHLPASGGKVCVLPGRYEENVLINARRNIVVSGCGPRSRVVSRPPAGEFGTAGPVIEIRDSQRITIEHLRIDADNTGIGVLVMSTGGVAIDFNQVVPDPTRNVSLRSLLVFAAMRSAIEVRVATVVAIRDCGITMADVASSWPGIFFIAEDGVIEHNVVRVASLRTPLVDEGIRVHAAAGLGGIQLGGTCERVHVEANLIQGGNGNGITLGSVLVVDDDGNDTGVDVGWVVNPDDPCFPCDPGDGYIPPDGGDDGTHYVSAGPLYEIYIERNRILDMGLDGIGVVGFWDLESTDEMISVERLTIVANEIRYCLQRTLAPIARVMRDRMGYGGIALADVEYLVARENVIEDNGPDFAQPVCGIFVLHGEGVDVTDNRIRNNGAKTGQPVGTAKDGQRGGIIVMYAIAPAIATDIEFFKIKLDDAPVQNGVPALRVHDNIVSVPVGRALSAVALGPVSVHANALTTHGVVPRRELLTPGLVAATVAILNLGMSNEVYLQLLAFNALANAALTIPGAVETDEAIIIPASGLDDLGVARLLADGTVQFTDNVVVLDLLETASSLTLSSVLIASLDDISFADNQCSANLAIDFVISDAIVVGFSLRMASNRFTEGVLGALFSALTFGVMNNTSQNQATHCIIAGASSPARLINVPNTILFPTSFCRRSDSTTIFNA
ncbi:MAG: DUF6519 domain-containing protein [Gemmatimonadales bacterium]